jgi:guanylate kinase
MHYNFVTRAQFEALRADDGFVETAEFGANMYGTSKAAVAAVAARGRTCLLDVEMGARAPSLPFFQPGPCVFFQGG